MHRQQCCLCVLEVPLFILFWHKQAAPSLPNGLFYCELIKLVEAFDDIDWIPAGAVL